MPSLPYKGLISFVAPIVMLLALGEALLSAWHLYVTNGWGFTGTFINSGPLACFLAVSLPCTIAVYRNSGKLILRIAAFITLILSAILIPYSLSRTAIAAAFVALLIFFFPEIKKRFSGKRVRLLPIFSITTVIIIAIAITLIIVKHDSAVGRLLIWKISIIALAKLPFWGVGWSRVPVFYAENQEEYFASNPQAIEDMWIADTPNYLFNDFLYTATAFGIPGLILLCAIIVTSIILCVKRKNYMILASFGGMIIVMTASYPLHSKEFLLLMALLLLGSTAGYRCKSKTAFLLPAYCAIIIVGLAQYIDISGQLYYVAIKLHEEKHYQESNHLLRDYLLERVADTSMLHLAGKNYQKLGMSDSAEFYFSKSVLRVPSRHYPHYLLMNLHLQTGDTAKAISEARILLSKTPKVLSPAIEDMRFRAASLIHSTPLNLTK